MWSRTPRGLTRTSVVLTLLLSRAVHAEWKASLQRALELHQTDQLDLALPHYKKALDDHAPLQTSWQVRNNYALALQQTGEPRLAVDEFRAVVRLNPDHADGFFNLGNALSDCSEHLQAVEAYEKCIALAPDDAGAHLNLGVAALLAGVDAEPSLRRAVELAPGDAKAHLSLGDALVKQKRLDEAAESYAKACALRADHKPSWASAAFCAGEMGDAVAAERHWRAALAVEPPDVAADAEAHRQLGALLRRANKMDQSATEYREALALEPASADAYIGLGKCYRAPRSTLATEEQRASYASFLDKTYGEALRLQPDHAGAYNAVGEGLAMFGHRGPNPELFGGMSALDFYASALEHAPNNTCAATHVAYDGEVDRGEAPPGVSAVAAHDEGHANAAQDDARGAEEVRSVTDLSVDVRPGKPLTDDALARARALWARHGVVVFPRAIKQSDVKTLRAAVLAAAVDDADASDYTAVTRDSRHRVHKALSVAKAKHALDAVARSLGPFLCEVLGDSGAGASERALSLLESGFMVTSPGASGQAFHRDVAPDVVSQSSLSASIQLSLVDTAAEQGALEVIPGSHAFVATSDEMAPQVGDAPKDAVALAVPEGTVAVYALHLRHRGRANTHDAKRPFYFFTLKGPGYAPPGLAYTIEMDDIRKWRLKGDRLASV